MKRDARWPIGIALLLTVFVTVNLMMMRVAGADPSFAVEPDYYRKAVEFDSTMAIDRRSAALGWTATSAITRGPDGSTLTVTLVDGAGQPVRGASVAGSVRFVARANDVHEVSLREPAPGRYSAPVDARHAGQWEVRIDAKRGASRFVASMRAEAPRLP
jgi:nitrogen fixation protein FixH